MKNNKNSIRPEKDASAKLKSILAQPSVSKTVKKKLRINVVPVIKEIPNNYEVLVAAERQLLEEVYQALKELLVLRGVRYALPGGKKRPLNLFLHYPRRKNSIKRTRPTTSTSSNVPAALTEAAQPTVPAALTEAAQPTVSAALTEAAQPTVPAALTEAAQPTVPAALTEAAQPTVPAALTEAAQPTVSAALTEAAQPTVPAALTEAAQPAVPAALTEATQNADTVFAGPSENSSLLSQFQTIHEIARLCFYYYNMYSSPPPPVLPPSSLVLPSAPLGNFRSTYSQIGSNGNYLFGNTRLNRYAPSSSSQRSSTLANGNSPRRSGPPLKSLYVPPVGFNRNGFQEAIRAAAQLELENKNLAILRRRRQARNSLSSISRCSIYLPPVPQQPTFMDFISEFKFHIIIISALIIYFNHL